MSRTDKTDPMWVRIQDPLNRSEVRVIHDHRFGPCDLDTWKPGPYKPLWWRRDGYCFKRPNPIRKLLCTCRGCRGLIYGEHGMVRAEWRAQRQAWLAGWGEYRKERGARKYWYD